VSEQLRIGVVGCGRMGGFHIRNYAQLDCAQLVAVADPSEESRRRALGDSRVAEYDDWREMIEFGAAELDAISIACPSEFHAEVALEALAAGLHVLVEKPIATTLPDALRMRGAAFEADRKLMVGHVERFNPAVEKLRELVADGRLGTVYRAHTTRVGPLPTRIQDTGVAIDLATHDLDVMQHVLDRSIHEIYADGGRFQHDSQEDLLTCLARFGEEG
jgi:UDP-N-acetylglucosamine 3-dehydrogenase